MHATTVSRARLAARQFIAALVGVLIAYGLAYALVAFVWALFA